MFTEATPELILQAYRQGIFPMAETGHSLFYNFYRPEQRGQLSIENLHIPKRLKKTARHYPYEITIDKDFVSVIDDCSAEGEGRNSTWINKTIRDVFIELHDIGFAHSVECWKEGKLVGGLYGIAIGKVFCGESMFSHERDASKIALLHLAARLWKAGFTVLDTQFTNPHLEQFGVYEISQDEYMGLVDSEMPQHADFSLKSIVPDVTEQELLETYLAFRNTQEKSGIPKQKKPKSGNQLST